MKPRMQNYLNVNSGLILLFLFISGCKSEVVYWKVESEAQTITEYIDTHGEFSEFFGLINSTKTNNSYQVSQVSSLLAIRGPFTLFLPDNDAMNAYYIKKGISSFTDLSADERTNLAMNHIVGAEIKTDNFCIGSLTEVNAIDDYIVTEFKDADIILNKYSKIIHKNINTHNGFIHVIDKVLEPITKNVYEILSEDSSYSIFKQAIDITGLKDTLQVITVPFGRYTGRARFTILAITDSIFNQFGINSIDDLVAKYTDDPDNATDINNGFYRYMEYHCLAGTFYFIDFYDSKIYPVLSYDNYVSVKYYDDFKINQDSVTKEFTAFIYDQSNIPGKNGAIHTIYGLLPVIQPKPTQIVWETTDHYDLKQSDFFGITYDRFYDGQNDFVNIRWEGSYLQYWYRDGNSAVLNHDCLSMSGLWWCQVTTPKILKGKYRLTSNLLAGWVDYDVFVDGVNTAFISLKYPPEITSWGEFNWDKTETHTVKVVAKSPGPLYWDALIFTPIKDSDWLASHN